MDPSTIILVLGGTGMLLPAVRGLLECGHTVALVARRPQHAGVHPRLLPIHGDWIDANGLARGVRAALGTARPSKAILWVHSPYKAAVYAALDSLLSPDAVVVDLTGSAGTSPPIAQIPEPFCQPRQYRQVVLGFMGKHGRPTRWLTDQEISDGSLKALDTPGSPQVVGRLEPWDERP
ncbi:uncharacterized protein N7498_010754 [Penicillium cinerascens]|uniref:NAD(P)-binding domain-containing protein n=1 Tax=Penicillium cinerascens TaxID=70096 RepID=A0A9W9M7M6_9EURO|nr:uncharacterized protein N7498_010754 [Penicillium cinerascens]KAJ5191769.1 hypothetical protein N7498_010754 [Penicillium cinerascens]